jgi:TIR domain
MRVFLSYANADVSTAETTANVLASDDYSVFFDRQSIRSGDVFSTAIKNALEECDIFVFFVSKNSVIGFTSLFVYYGKAISA